MDLIDEKDVAFFQVGEKCRQIAGLFDDRARGAFDVCAHFSSDDVGQRGFTQSGWTIKQHVVEGLLPHFCGGYEDVQVFLDLFLTDIVGQFAGPETVVVLDFFVIQFRIYESVFFHSFCLILSAIGQL